MFPTQGRIVHFYPNGLGAIGGTAINDEPMAAIVAFDNREKTGKINLLVIDHEGTPFASSAVFVDHGEAVPLRGSECYCRWPVRVGIEDSPMTAGEPRTEQQHDDQKPTATTDGSGDVEAPSTEVANPGGDQDEGAVTDAPEAIATASS